MFKDQRFTPMNMTTIRHDLIAGLTVGVVAIPLGMAFAIASGVPPEYGLYTTIIAGFLVAIFGGSRYQIAGPTGAFIPILLAVVLQYGYENLLIAGMMAGIMLIIMSIFKFGQLITYIPRSVTIGFTTGIAVIIFSGQIENFLGLENLEKKQYFHETMLEIARHLHTINFYSVMTALLGLLIIIFLPKFLPKVPPLLFALIIPTVISIVLFPGKLATIGTAYGGISQSLPTFQLPSITWEKLMSLWQPAFAIAMLGGIESLLSAVVADGMTGKKHHSNRELFGQGLANLVTPLFGGIPATGAIARTATNIRSGALSPLSGVFQSVFVLLCILLFAPYASYIPLASMAPILMVVAWNMSEYKSFYRIVKFRTADSLVLVVTFVLTVTVNLTIAVPIGLLLAMLSFIKRMTETLKVDEVQPDVLGTYEIDDVHAYRCPQIATYTVHGALFFGAADKFSNTLNTSLRDQPEVLLLKMRYVSMIDITGLNNLSMALDDFMKKGGKVIITELSGEPLAFMKQSDLYEKIGPENFYTHTKEAYLQATRQLDVSKCSYCGKHKLNTCAIHDAITK